MSEFNEKYEAKYKEFQLKKKKTSNKGMILLILGLIIFSALFIYNIQKKQALEATKEAAAYNELEIKTQKREQDSILRTIKMRKDSVRQVVQQAKDEIKEIKSSSGVNTTVRERIDSIEVKLNTIEYIAERIIVRYYKRIADGDKVEEVINQIKEPHFDLHHRDVPNDDGKRKVNALYYGKNVDESHVQLLYKKLIDNGVDIQHRKPFVSAKGFEWKQDAMEIGYEKPTSTTDVNGGFYIRIYGFKTNEKTKYAIRNKLEAKGYQVRLYPDWRDLPSFFSKQSTVLYYEKSNSKKAQSVAEVLTKLTGIKFQINMGSGYGVSPRERKNTFIVHYNGN